MPRTDNEAGGLPPGVKSQCGVSPKRVRNDGKCCVVLTGHGMAPTVFWGNEIAKGFANISQIGLGIILIHMGAWCDSIRA